MNFNNIKKSKLLDFWLLYIENIYPKNTHLSLNRIKLVAKKLDLLHCRSFVFTISGTNGKGSTCAVLESFFLSSGYQVGLYTSPHLINYYERIRVNGKFLKDDLFHIEIFKIIESVRQDIPLTYFEFITLSALLIFKIYNLNIIILEVGLGGRFDATNIVDANISILTNIALDHTKILGNNREIIALEKAGIFRKRRYAVIGDNNIPGSIYQFSTLIQTNLYRVFYEWDWNRIGNVWNYYDIYGGLYNLPIPKVFLSSAALALSALRVSHFIINKKILKKSLKNIFYPGRFQIIYDNPKIILDVAHNPHAANFLCKKIKKLLFQKSKDITLYGIIGMVSDKDIKNTIFPFLNIIDFWYYSVIKTNRSANLSTFKKILPKCSIACISIEQALFQLIQKIKKTDIILVFGSFFAVSEAMLFFKKYYNIQDFL